MVDRPDLEYIKEISEAVTVGAPWGVPTEPDDPEWIEVCGPITGRYGYKVVVARLRRAQEPEARFIMLARTELPAVVEYALELETERDTLARAIARSERVNTNGKPDTPSTP